MNITPLTEEQVHYIRSLDIPEESTVPVRFMYNGHPVNNLLTGELGALGTSVMHQQAFWNFDRKTAYQIAVWLGVTPMFDHKPRQDQRIKYQK